MPNRIGILGIPSMPEPEEESAILVPVDNWKCPKCGQPLSVCCGKIDVGNRSAEFVIEVKCEAGEKSCIPSAFRLDISAEEDPKRYRQIKEALAYVLLNMK